MIVEIIEFYPLQRDEVKDTLTGTLRIKLPDLGIHILGIYLSKKKDYWHFILPGQKSTHHQTGEIVRYPVLAFDDPLKQKELIDAIRSNAPAFIEKRLADVENPLIFPDKKQQTKKATETQKSSSQELSRLAHEKPKTSPAIEKKPVPQKLVSSFQIPCNEWVSLPPRPQQKKQKYR